VNAPRRPGLLTRFATLVVVWAALAGLVVLQLAPNVPETRGGWALVVVLGPPVYLGLEWVFGGLFSKETGARISASRFSVARIAVALLIALVVIAPFAWWYLRTRLAG
jgi:hypothetical protein